VEDQVAKGDKVVTRWSFLGILRLTSICLVEAWARVQAEQSIWRIRLEAADRAVIRICPQRRDRRDPVLEVRGGLRFTMEIVNNRVQ
jgi:hypothetical protein